MYYVLHPSSKVQKYDEQVEEMFKVLSCLKH